MEAGQAFVWGEEQENAFVDLKSVLTGKEVMAYPRDHGLFILDTDSSNFAIGGCLSQLQWCELSNDYVEKPIIFASKSLQKSQRLYCATRKELLAVITFMTQFRYYLLGKEFLLRTDCSSLRWIMSFKSPTDQMARWLEVLSQYNFKIEHRSGKKHVNVDSLSRIPCDPDECQCYDQKTILEDLPCEGCDTCLKRHALWSDFAQFDDVVPLFDKRRAAACQRIQGSSCSGISKSRQGNEFWSWIFLLMQLQFVKLLNCVTSLYTGFIKLRKYCRSRVSRLRFHDSFDTHVDPRQDSSLSDDNDAKVQKKDVKSILVTEVSLDENRPHVSSLGSLADFGTVNYSPQRMAKLQRQDPDIGVVVKWLQSDSERPSRDIVAGYSPTVRHYWLSWDLLVIVDGVLFMKYICTTKEECLLLVVPTVLRKEILVSTHDSVTGGHLGITKTLSKIRNKFHWYKMRQSVEIHIKQCEKCALRKRPYKTPRSPLSEYTVGHPMDRISTDIMGPMPKTDNENQFVLVVMCNFTKWVECYAIKDQSASTVAEKIVYEFLSRYGMCLDLHSDLGTNYQSKLFSEVCRMLEINQTRTSGYRPMANGGPEKFNQVLQNMITTYVNSNQTNWDRDLNLITSAYRSTVNQSTGFSPNMLMLGREVLLPVQISMGCIPNTKRKQRIVDYVIDLENRMSKAYEITRYNLKKNASRQKKDYDTRIHKTTYNQGDLVLCWDKSRVKGRSKKIEPCIWKGPFIVSRKINDVLFEIKMGPASKSKIMHHDRLKPYHGRQIPQWCSNRLPVNKTPNNSLSGQKNRKYIKKFRDGSQPARRSDRNRIPFKPFQY